MYKQNESKEKQYVITGCDGKKEKISAKELDDLNERNELDIQRKFCKIISR